MISKKDALTFREFMEKGNCMVFYHGDADGVISASFVKRFFHGFEYMFLKAPAIESWVTDTINRERPERIAFLDLAIDHDNESLEKLMEDWPDMEIMIVDHHKIHKDMNSEKCTHINPRFKKSDAYIPCSYVVYELLELGGFDVKPFLWIACTGIIADYGVEDCKSVLEECRKAFPYSIEGNDYFESKLGEISTMVSSGIILRDEKAADKILSILSKITNFQDLYENSQFRSWRNKVEKEVEKVVNAFDIYGKKYNGLILFNIKTKFGITSVISTRLSEDYPEKTVIVMKRVKTAYGIGYKLSARNQSGRVDVGSLLKKCTKGLGNGGGHERAAGGFIDDIETFKKRIFKELNIPEQ